MYRQTCIPQKLACSVCAWPLLYLNKTLVHEHMETSTAHLPESSQDLDDLNDGATAGAC